jgi:hypothetical protein
LHHLVLFLIASSALGKITDPRAPFDAVARVHQDVNLPFILWGYCLDIALLAVLCGGLPVLFTAIWRAFAARPVRVLELFKLRPKLLLRLLGGAFLFTVLFVGYLISTEILFSPASSQQALSTPLLLLLNVLGGTAALTVIAFVVVVIVAALSAAVARSEFGPKLLNLSLLAMLLSTCAMGIAAVATTIWVIRLWLDAPQFAMSGDGLGGTGMVWVVAVIAAMAISTVVASFACWRAVSARRPLPA